MHVHTYNTPSSNNSCNESCLSSLSLFLCISITDTNRTSLFPITLPKQTLPTHRHNQVQSPFSLTCALSLSHDINHSNNHLNSHFTITILTVYAKTRTYKQTQTQSSGCGAVGRAVASKNNDPRFESSHRQYYSLSTVFKTHKLYLSSIHTLYNFLFLSLPITHIGSPKLTHTLFQFHNQLGLTFANKKERFFALSKGPES